MPEGAGEATGTPATKTDTVPAIIRMSAVKAAFLVPDRFSLMTLHAKHHYIHFSNKVKNLMILSCPAKQRGEAVDPCQRSVRCRSLTFRLIDIPETEVVDLFSRGCETMKKAEGHPASLRDGDRIVVIGGGPAGSFFAIKFLRECRRLERRIEVVIVEKRRAKDPGGEGYRLDGCTFCAGGISPRLNRVLRQNDLALPGEIIQKKIDYIWLHGQWKNFRFRVPRGDEMFSVFRGSLPSGRGAGARGLDGFLLGKAVGEGARVLNGEVRSLCYSESGMPRLSVKMPSGELTSIDCGFAVLATGINARCGRDHGEGSLTASIKEMNPSFVPARSRRAFLFELDLGDDYLKRNVDREIHFIEYGSERIDLEHTALLPKGRYLSVAMIGKSIDRAALPQDSTRIIREFAMLPHIRRILPGVESAPVACACSPMMAAAPARNPRGGRFALIGDAAGARLNKDGLFSAYLTASTLSRAILHDGVSEQAIERGYGKAVRWLAEDNRYGRIVFGISRVAFAWPWVSRVMYQSLATEFKRRDEDKRPLGSVMWKIASGAADYREILREMFRFPAIRAFMVGTAVTLRNVAFELLFSLKWGKNGRYPTVVLREKREVVKRWLASSLGEEVDGSPDFERMYVIKIRGSRDRIAGELAKFGSREAKFLNLRFVSVRHLGGEPNEVGSVVQYRVPLIGLATEMRLARKAGQGTFLYRLDDSLADRGKLIFDIAPTKDGNNKLSIYAAVDYKKGTTLTGRVFWYSARALFPEFVHDVVWNHALCTIKEEIEK